MFHVIRRASTSADSRGVSRETELEKPRPAAAAVAHPRRRGPRFGSFASTDAATVRCQELAFHVNDDSRGDREDIRPRTRRALRPLPGTRVRGILRREVAAVRPSLEGPCGRVRPLAKSPRFHSPDDPAARRGRSDGDGLAGTDRRSIPADRNAEPHLGARARDRRDGGGRSRGRVWSGPSLGASSLDVLAQRPLGSTSFALLSVRRRDVRPGGLSSSAFASVVPIIATFLLSLVYSMIHFVALNALVAPIPVSDPVSLVLPASSTTRSSRP